jgi:hypothetical protein
LLTKKAGVTRAHTIKKEEGFAVGRRVHADVELSARIRMFSRRSLNNSIILLTSPSLNTLQPNSLELAKPEKPGSSIHQNGGVAMTELQKKMIECLLDIGGVFSRS